PAAEPRSGRPRGRALPPDRASPPPGPARSPERPAPRRRRPGPGASAGSLPQCPEHFLGGALARAHRSVHVAVPVVGGLGAGPVDVAEALPQRRAELRQHVLARVANWTAPRPGLLGP